MKFNFASVTLFLTAAVSTVAATSLAPSPLELTPREYEIANNAIYNLQHYNSKRSLLTEAELSKRESDIVTQILTIVKDTNLAPGVIHYLISDFILARVTKQVVITAIQNGWINLGTLMKSLNDSGLAISVIEDLINDCAFYTQMFKLIGNLILGLPTAVSAEAGVSPQVVSAAVSKRDEVPLYARDAQDVLTSLMESLKDSGLANQVVEALVIDDDFYTFGADLVSKLFSSGAITLEQLGEDLVNSGLLPPILNLLLNVDTIQKIVIKALGAALGTCRNSPTTSSIVTKPTGGPAPTVSTGSVDLSTIFDTIVGTETPADLSSSATDATLSPTTVDTSSTPAATEASSDLTYIGLPSEPAVSIDTTTKVADVSPTPDTTFSTVTTSSPPKKCRKKKRAI